MTTIFEIDTYQNGNRFLSTLSAEDDGGDTTVVLALKLGPNGDVILTVECDLQSGSYSVTPSSTITTGSICIAGCGVASFAGAIFECWRKAKKSQNRKKAFISCLKGKGVNIASSYIQCVIGCLSGAVSANLP